MSLVLPSYLVILAVARVLEKFRQNTLVSHAFEGLRPAATGLIAAAGWSVLQTALLGGAGVLGLRYSALLLFVVMMVLTNLPGLKKLHPVLFIALGAVCGLVFQM